MAVPTAEPAVSNRTVVFVHAKNLPGDGQEWIESVGSLCRGVQQAVRRKFCTSLFGNTGFAGEFRYIVPGVGVTGRLPMRMYGSEMIVGPVIHPNGAMSSPAIIEGLIQAAVIWAQKERMTAVEVDTFESDLLAFDQMRKKVAGLKQLQPINKMFAGLNLHCWILTSPGR